MSISESYAKWRYRLLPDHVIGEILSKTWIDTAIPVFMLILIIVLFRILEPTLLTFSSMGGLVRIFGEYIFVVMGLAITMLGGGIDLSVGSIFGLCNFVALTCLNLLGWPLWIVIVSGLVVGGIIGAVNGILIGYLRLRAFLTTLGMMIIGRGFIEVLSLRYATDVQLAEHTSPPIWEFMGDGTVLGIPSSVIISLVLAVFLHIFLTRMRWGWHIISVGGSRRSAYNSGIDIRRTVFLTYVMSGLLTSAGALFCAARLSSTGANIGLGMEMTVLTAAVLGGCSLGGGRGSIAKAVLGMAIVLIIMDSLVRLGFRSGSSSLVLGIVMLFAVMIDVRWLKNRHKLLNRVYVSPAYLSLPQSPYDDPVSGKPYAMNDLLTGAEAIGLNEVDGAEDIIFDRQDNLYTGSRHGDIIRFFPPDYKRWELFVHTGGHPLGMAMDREGNLHSCVSGMGLYKITPEREVIKLTAETNRRIWSVIDDSRMRLADDLDIVPDGRVFFSEATIRFNMSDWMIDALESRGNGRIIRYDPRDQSSRTVIPNLVFPNGICLAWDGHSILFAESWACRVSRYWLDGPKAGKVERVISDLPGYPDNINRASDGKYWLAMLGMRSAVFDIAQRMPGFRRRMVRYVARDEWLFPNSSRGCVIKFDESGRVLESLWDREGDDYPEITSIREHRGYLYLAGIFNNRIGRVRIPGADPEWTGMDAYWGPNA